MSGRALLWCLRVRIPAVASNKPVQIVAVGTVSAERFFVKQPLNSTSQAHLIGMALRPYRPTHFPVPAAAQNQNCGSSDSCCH